MNKDQIKGRNRIYEKTIVARRANSRWNQKDEKTRKNWHEILSGALDKLYHVSLRSGETYERVVSTYGEAGIKVLESLRKNLINYGKLDTINEMTPNFIDYSFAA